MFGDLNNAGDLLIRNVRQYPGKVAIISSTKNPSGKVLKTELREKYWKGRERRV